MQSDVKIETRVNVGALQDGQMFSVPTSNFPAKEMMLLEQAQVDGKFVLLVTNAGIQRFMVKETSSARYTFLKV